jgi:hypothetical protein
LFKAAHVQPKSYPGPELRLPQAAHQAFEAKRFFRNMSAASLAPGAPPEQGRLTVNAFFGVRLNAC